MVAFGTLAAGGYAADVPLPNSHASPRPDRSFELRRLSRREIYEAVENDLARKGIAGRAVLRPEDLSIQASIPMRILDAGLQVKRITYDPLRRETAFELKASQAPEYLPFKVTTRRDPRTLGLFGRSPEDPGGDHAGRPAAGFHGGTPSVSKPAALVRPGRPAILVMYGQNARITTSVVPLQPGTLGQRILVRDPATARVIYAEVSGDGLLQASF